MFLWHCILIVLLCVAAACRIQCVQNMMTSVTKVGNFFNTPKRQILLEKMIKKFCPSNRHTKLIDICRTRWVLRIDGLDRFLELYLPLFESLSVIKDNADGTWTSSASDAYSYHIILENFTFLNTLVIVKHCLAFTRSATVQLQGSHIDVMAATKEIDMMLESLRNVRKFLDCYHKAWFTEESSIAEHIDCAIKHPRVCSQQAHRSNMPAKDTPEYFKINIAIPFLDKVITEISNRFANENCVAIKGLSIVPSVMALEYKEETKSTKRKFDQISCDISSNMESKLDKTSFCKRNSSSHDVVIQRIDKKWKENFQNFCIQYLTDLPNPLNVTYEVDNWESFWKDQLFDTLPCNIPDTLKRTNPITFPNIFTVLTILAVLPITSCTCERSASSIRLLKTYMRSRMIQQRLNGLASIYTHKDIPIDTNSVIDKFARQHKRRMTLRNILKSDDDLQADDDIVQSEVY